jgi:hypothetical protein
MINQEDKVANVIENQEPKFSKGDLVRPRDLWTKGRHLYGFRVPDASCNITSEHPAVPSTRDAIPLIDGRYYTVVKARVSPSDGVVTIKKCCEIFDPITGLTFYVRRNDLEKVGDENVQASS